MTETEKFLNEIARKIRIARADKHITQSKLAEMIKISPSAVSAWENAKKSPSLFFAKKLENVLGVRL